MRRVLVAISRKWVLVAALLIGTVVFSLGRDDWKRPLTEPTADAAYYYVYLPSIFLDGDVDFANEYAVTKNWYELGPTPTGKPGNVFGIGPAILQTPAFLIGHAIARIAGSRSDGFSDFETFLVLWTSVLFTVGALALAARLAARRAGPGAASIVGAVTALLAGPVGYYAVRQPGYAHPYATFCVAWLVERWDASYELPGPRSTRTWVVLGLALGLSTLVRPQLALWGVLLIGAAASDLKRRGNVSIRRLLVRWALSAFVAFVAFSPQLIAWKSLYGEWYLVPQGSGFMRWDEPAWTETLFSSRNGLFPWAPLYGPMLLGLVFIKHRLRLVVALVGGIFAQSLANGAAWDWWAGGSFGGRRFDSTFVVFALGASALVHRGFDLISRLFRSPQLSTRAWTHKLAAVGAAAALALSALVAIAQVELMLKTSVISARIGGGEPAARVWRRRVGGVTGTLSAELSNWVAAPAAATFSIRHDVPLSAYGEVVGVHSLGELYPGLNPIPDKQREVVQLKNLRDPWFRGLALERPGLARMTSTSARIYIGLNRRPPIRVRIRLSGDGHIRISWNEEPLISTVLLGNNAYEFNVEGARGTNWLVLQAPVGTQVADIELDAVPQ